MAGSCFLSPAEKNYAVIELELLAIQWATEKCRLYLAGADFTIVTDHQPLLGVLNRKNLDAINNVRIQRLMSKLLGYSFKVEWIPGKNHAITDAPNHKDVIVCKISVDIEDMALAELSRIATENKDYQEVVNTVLSRTQHINTVPNGMECWSTEYSLRSTGEWSSQRLHAKKCFLICTYYIQASGKH